MCYMLFSVFAKWRFGCVCAPRAVCLCVCKKQEKLHPLWLHRTSNPIPFHPTVHTGTTTYTSAKTRKPLQTEFSGWLRRKFNANAHVCAMMKSKTCFVRELSFGAVGYAISRLEKRLASFLKSIIEVGRWGVWAWGGWGWSGGCK